MRITRRSFLAVAAMGVAGCVTARRNDVAGVFPEYRDEVTGSRVRMLTHGPEKDSVVYQTHPMWTKGMRRMMFHTERPGSGPLWAVDMALGEARPLLDGPAGAAVLARKDDRLYFQRDREIRVTRLDAAYEGKRESELVSVLPTFVDNTDGGLTLDAREDVLYTGGALSTSKKNAVLALHLASGAWRKVAEVDFRVGHFQANPERTGVVMFCWETGGDAPQRTWVINADGTGLRPMYKETYEEWVTHEAWWGADRVVFTIWPYDEEHEKKPHGILSVDCETGTPTVHAQYKAWHTHGSPDGEWILGDDFDRNLWLIKAATGERRLWTQGHRGEGFDTHPHASFTPDGRGAVFGSSRNGAEDVFWVEMPERFEDLPEG